MKTFFGFGWAQPVISHRKAAWCSTLEFLYKLSGRRRFGPSKHTAWERAVGIG